MEQNLCVTSMQEGGSCLDIYVLTLSSLSLQDYPDALITNYYVRVDPSSSCSVSVSLVMP